VARGGARSHSGPAKDENSRTSERAGFSLTALPPAGYDGEVPKFPLPTATDRELEVWADVWTYPQACAWIDQPRLWRHVAMYVRWSVRMEAEDASAALGNVVMRYADDAGISEAGLKFHGWKIAEPKPVVADPAPGEGASVTSIKDRLPRESA
jgi:hypothetical protein